MGYRDGHKEWDTQMGTQNWGSNGNKTTKDEKINALVFFGAKHYEGCRTFQAILKALEQELTTEDIKTIGKEVLRLKNLTSEQINEQIVMYHIIIGIELMKKRKSTHHKDDFNKYSQIFEETFNNLFLPYIMDQTTKFRDRTFWEKKENNDIVVQILTILWDKIHDEDTTNLDNSGLVHRIILACVQSKKESEYGEVFFS